MYSILDILANPPDSFLPSSHSSGPTPKSKVATVLKKRDYSHNFPEPDFCAPNSPKHVVDKARCIYILIDEVFSPIFTKDLQPFFPIRKLKQISRLKYSLYLFIIDKKRERPIFTPSEDR